MAAFVNHRVRVDRERETHLPPGQMVAVNGHRLHVYSEGAGQPTLVFLAGSGTTAPTFDFRGLYRRLSGDYRTVVVERSGYGWSDDSNASRDTLAEISIAQTNAELVASRGFPDVAVPNWRELLIEYAEAAGGRYRLLEVSHYVHNLATALRDSVDDYVSWCTEEGIPPERPYSGKFNLRLSPEPHREVAIVAKRRNTSINAFVEKAIEDESRVAKS